MINSKLSINKKDLDNTASPDIYNKKYVEEIFDEDELTPEEEGFMLGYLDAE